jgi:periplasmic protein CpxP/Spy
MKKMTILVLSALLSVPVLAQQDGSDPSAGEAEPGAMQQRMREMREQMAAIHQTEDREERRRLMREHMESMHQGMAAMQEATRRPTQQRQQCAQGDTSCEVGQLQMQQEMMEQRMAMMQMMMEQMMEHMQMHGVGEPDEGDSGVPTEHHEGQSHQ